ncbi:MAG: hypothetical protein ACPHL6_02445, partial [Rubripirellula sp.]
SIWSHRPAQYKKSAGNDLVDPAPKTERIAREGILDSDGTIDGSVNHSVMGKNGRTVTSVKNYHCSPVGLVRNADDQRHNRWSGVQEEDRRSAKDYCSPTTHQCGSLTSLVIASPSLLSMHDSHRKKHHP